ncbi:MAG: hypothetical protein MI919_17185, partial [Holophagales bacterium]|nr:hypothetical protein [Holophagales bacterium]
MTEHTPLSHRAGSSPLDRRGTAARTATVLLIPLLAATWAQTADAQAVDPYLALSRTSSGPTSSEFFFFRLGGGSGSRASGLRRNPDEIEVRRLESNLFRQIGRATDQAAQVGEIFLEPILESDGAARSALFVETSTGYTVYFSELGRGGKLGEMITLLGRPFGPLAAADGNFALLPRRSGSGRTEGAYLYHATTGRGLYLGGLQELEIDPPVSATVPLPSLGGKVTAVSLTSSEETTGFLLIDHADGKVGILELTGGRPEQLEYRETQTRITPSFASESLNPSPRRYSAIPIQDGEDSTLGVLVVDVGSGQMGYLTDLSSGEPQIAVFPQKIYEFLPTGVAETPRSFELVAHRESRRTRGFWLLDSLTAAILYVSSPTNPAELTIR